MLCIKRYGVILFMLGLHGYDPGVQLGLDHIPYAMKNKLNGKSIALVVDKASYNSSGMHSYDCLKNEGIQISKVFHGVDCEIRSMLNSLNYDFFEIAKESQDIDAFIVDLTDFGLRNSRSTLMLIDLLSLASQYKKDVFVLDRPNPLGNRIEGPVGGALSGVIPMPIRHGLTLGELAWFLNKRYIARPVNLYVICMKNYKRGEVKANNQVAIEQTMALFQMINVIRIDKSQKLLIISVDKQIDLWNSFVDSLCSYCLHATYDELLSEVHLPYDHLDSNATSYIKLMLYIVDFLKSHCISVDTSSKYDDILEGTIIRRYIEKTCTLKELVKVYDNETALFYRNVRSSLMYNPLPIACALEDVAWI